MIITIDGPAASGKSSIAKKLSNKLGFLHFSTGLMYRAITSYIIINKLDNDLPKSIISHLSDVNLVIKPELLNTIYINNKDYSKYYFINEVNQLVSSVSAISEIRQKFVEIQRNVSLDNDIICEGRDIGTVVFPRAEFKFFLEASVDCRAQRRFNEMKLNESNIDIMEVKNMIVNRDQIDINRTESPLKKAVDAILIETTDLTIREVVDKMYKIINGSN